MFNSNRDGFKHSETSLIIAPIENPRYLKLLLFFVQKSLQMELPDSESSSGELTPRQMIEQNKAAMNYPHRFLKKPAARKARQPYRSSAVLVKEGLLPPVDDYMRFDRMFTDEEVIYFCIWLLIA